MLKLTSDITIGGFKLAAVHAVEVDSSWDDLTDTCTIKLPRAPKWEGREIATGDSPVLKRGMEVFVRLGYDGGTVEVFRGFIRDIKAKTPVEIICEDAMYLLKKGSFTNNKRNWDLKQLVAAIVGNVVPFEVVANQEIGQYRFSKVTPAQVLSELREKRFVRSFFREGILYVGWLTVPKLQQKRVFRFGHNIISDELEYRIEDDVQVKLKGIIMYPDNKKKEIEIGDVDGEERTFHQYNISEGEMRKLMEVELDRLRYTGYRGSFMAFGSPAVRHGDIVELQDPYYPQRTGKYFAKSVRTSFGMDGYRQEIELEGAV